MRFATSEEVLSNRRFISSDDLEVDMSLDTRGVILEESIYCAYCMTRMTEIEPNKFRCPHCHVVFNGVSA